MKFVKPVIILFFFISFYGYGQQNLEKNLRPINFNDKKYDDIRMYCKTITTPQGWKIEYFVKNDKTKYQDLYIKWSKGKVSRIYFFEDVLIMRVYFIPMFKSENEDYLYLTHGCSTSGAALLILPKSPKQKTKDYSYIVDYDVKTNRLVYIPERSYSLDELEVSVVDLKQQKEKPVVFKNECDGSPEEGCIDKIVFNKASVELSATLHDKSDKKRKRTLLESHKVEFK